MHKQLTIKHRCGGLLRAILGSVLDITCWILSGNSGSSTEGRLSVKITVRKLLLQSSLDITGVCTMIGAVYIKKGCI